MVDAGGDGGRLVAQTTSGNCYEFCDPPNDLEVSSPVHTGLHEMYLHTKAFF